MLARSGAWERCVALSAEVGAGMGGAVAHAATAQLATGDAAGLRATAARTADTTTPDLRASAAATLARGLSATLDTPAEPALALLLDAARLFDLAAPSVGLAVGPGALAATVACNLWELDVAAQLVDPATTTAAVDAERLLRAWIALRRGDVVAATATVEHVRASGRLGPRDDLVACAIESGAARRRGDLASMDRAWRQARTLLLRVRPDLLILQPLGELLIAGARLGDHGTVRTGVAAVHRLLDRAGNPALWTLPVLWTSCTSPSRPTTPPARARRRWPPRRSRPPAVAPPRSRAPGGAGSPPSRGPPTRNRCARPRPAWRASGCAGRRRG